MRVQLFLRVCIWGERLVCRALLALGATLSTNMDTRGCCYFRSFELSICVSSMFMLNPHTVLGTETGSITLDGLRTLLSLVATGCRHSETLCNEQWIMWDWEIFVSLVVVTIDRVPSWAVLATLGHNLESKIFTMTVLHEEKGRNMFKYIKEVVVVVVEVGFIVKNNSKQNKNKGSAILCLHVKFRKKAFLLLLTPLLPSITVLCHRQAQEQIILH